MREAIVTREWAGEPAVEAAGGVVLRGTGGATGHLEVLVVHRGRYDDWSLPKGKLDPGESHADAAVREVEEETGVRVGLDAELPQIVYPVEGGIKRVRWFAMHPVAGDPQDRPADHEVDDARWLDVDLARDRLTYDADRALLSEALAVRTGGGAP